MSGNLLARRPCARARACRSAAPPAEEGKIRRMTGLLEDIEDDLAFVAGLRQHWCAEEEARKAAEAQETGVRDGARPHLLPCLRRRYSQDCSDCEMWVSELCKSAGVDLHSYAAASPARAGGCRQGAGGAAKSRLAAW